jgi:hypothetical protein
MSYGDMMPPEKRMSDKECVELRDYIEVQIKALKEATNLARENMERRLEGMNEFRHQLNSQAATFITREAFEARHNLLQIQVDELRAFKATSEGKASQISVLIATGIGLAGVVLALWQISMHYFGGRP